MFEFKRKWQTSRKYPISREYLSLVEFMVSDIDERSIEGVFASFDKFLHNYYQVQGLLVLSIPLDKSNEQFINSYRAIYNREKIGATFSKDLLQLVTTTWQEGDDGGGRTHRFEYQGITHYFFELGVMDGQRFACLFAINGEQVLSDDICFYLGKFFRKSMIKAREWKMIKDENALIHLDDVTLLYNQRKLIVDLNALIEHYQHYKMSFTVLFVDIDHFKNVNDRFGHLVGTKILKEMSDLLRAKLRETDYIYRYGGDEFVLLVPDCNAVMGQTIGERILRSIKNHTFDIPEAGPIRITVSIGVACFPKDADDWRGILNMADQMMYSAKDQGRGRVCLAGEIFKED